MAILFYVTTVILNAMDEEVIKTSINKWSSTYISMYTVSSVADRTATISTLFVRNY